MGVIPPKEEIMQVLDSISKKNNPIFFWIGLIIGIIASVVLCWIKKDLVYYYRLNPILRDVLIPCFFLLVWLVMFMGARKRVIVLIISVLVPFYVSGNKLVYFLFQMVSSYALICGILIIISIFAMMKKGYKKKWNEGITENTKITLTILFVLSYLLETVMLVTWVIPNPFILMGGYILLMIAIIVYQGVYIDSKKQENE